MVDTVRQRQVGVGITGATPLPSAVGANFFHFTILGPEVQLLVGTVNLLQLHEANAGADSVTIEPDITHRFLLSPVGFAALKAQIEAVEKSVPPVAGIAVETIK